MQILLCILGHVVVHSVVFFPKKVFVVLLKVVVSTFYGLCANWHLDVQVCIFASAHIYCFDRKPMSARHGQIRSWPFVFQNCTIHISFLRRMKIFLLFKTFELGLDMCRLGVHMPKLGVHMCILVFCCIEVAQCCFQTVCANLQT